MAQTLPVYRMLNQLASPKAKVVRRLSPRITRELERVSSLPGNIWEKKNIYRIDVLKEEQKKRERKYIRERYIWMCRAFRSSPHHGLLLSPRDDGFRCDSINLDLHIGNARTVKG
jgi:hypothetical protein